MSEEDLVGEGVENGVPPAEVMPRLLVACPSFATAWQAHLAWWGDDERGVYNDASELAAHLVDLVIDGRVAELGRAFAQVEELLLAGNRATRAMLIVGLIEDVQNIASNRGRHPEEFFPFLGGETAAAWRRVEAYWRSLGATSLADVIAAELGQAPMATPPIDRSGISNLRLRNIVDSLQRQPSSAQNESATVGHGRFGRLQRWWAKVRRD